MLFFGTDIGMHVIYFLNFFLLLYFMFQPFLLSKMIFNDFLKFFKIFFEYVSESRGGERGKQRIFLVRPYT